MNHWLDGAVTTLAFCWRMARRDGMTLGFTSHDQDLMIDGLMYRASPGMVPSAIDRSTGFDLDSVDLKGALTSDAIKEDDLMAGRWDGASLWLFAVDWRAPERDPVALLRGTLGAVEFSGNQFGVELRGPTADFAQPVVEATSPHCRASLGDKRCGVDMASRSARAAVLGMSGAQLTLDQSTPGGVFARGTLRFLDGKNAGLSVTILEHDGAVLTLSELPFHPILPGTRVALMQGCDRQFATCRDRFANALNFRGEPHLPGNDVLTRYAS
jgi:uncharacterized phage protein (TIGR02218 family)